MNFFVTRKLPRHLCRAAVAPFATDNLASVVDALPHPERIYSNDTHLQQRYRRHCHAPGLPNCVTRHAVALDQLLPRRTALAPPPPGVAIRCTEVVKTEAAPMEG
jgi:hypothetical protein